MQRLIIHNPKNCDLSKIDKKTTMTSDSITVVLTYPNGFVLTNHMTASTSQITTNRPLLLNPDGSYSIPD